MKEKWLKYLKIANFLAIASLIVSLIVHFLVSEFTLSGQRHSGTDSPAFLLFICFLFSFFIVVNFNIIANPNTESLEKVSSIVSLFMFTIGILFICYTAGAAA